MKRGGGEGTKKKILSEVEKLKSQHTFEICGSVHVLYQLKS